MSRKYKFHDQEQLYFVSFATVYWIDALTRNEYKDIIIDSLKYCIEEKDLDLYAWVIMRSAAQPNHVHLIIGTRGEPLQNIMRDLKKFTSKKIVEAIRNNPQESRREWMIWMFERAGKKNSNNEVIQFWQQHNQPIELTTAAMIKQKLERAANRYLHQNPVIAGFVRQPQDWVYSSAVDYYTDNQKGLILNLSYIA
jgi:putative transposase